MAEASSTVSLLDPTAAFIKLIDCIVQALPEDQGHLINSEAKSHWENGRGHLYISLVLRHSSVLFNMGEKDVEGCFQVLISILEHIHEPQLASNAVSEILKTVAVKEDTDKAPLRLRLLCGLYNALPSGTRGRFNVLLALINFARATSQVGVLQDFFITMEATWWKQNWRDLSILDERDLYLAISEALEEAGKTSLAHRFLIKFLATFTDDSKAHAADELASVQDLAVKGVVSAVKAPIESLTSRADLLNLKAIRQLKGHPQYGAIYHLLEVFSFGRLSDYLKFQEGHKDLLSQHGINHDKAMADMRLLSLGLLASDYEEIPYAEISRTLQVPQDEVEMWVVRAITANLIEAKMDQQKDWKKLQEKLQSWKANIDRLLDNMERSKALPA